MSKVLYTAFDVVPAPKGASTRISHMLQGLSEFTELNAVFLGEPGYLAQDTWCGADVIRLIATGVPFLERVVRFAEQVLLKVHQTQPDIVHFRSLWDGYPLTTYRNTHRPTMKLIYEVHGLPSMELEHHLNEFPPTLMEKIKKQEQVVLQQADFLICPSVVSQKYLMDCGVPAKKIAVIHNGVDIQQFRPIPSPSKEIPLLVYMGTLAPWQGLEGLLEALQTITAPFQLKIVGKGNSNWQNDLITRIFQLGLSQAVTVEGPQPHEMMPALLAEADICLAPLDTSDRNTVQGCNPIKLLEYMACGKAVIAPDLPVIREVLDNDEGLFYVGGDISSLHQAIDTLLQNPIQCQELGQNARKKVETHFQWIHSRQKLKQVYEKLAHVKMIL